MSIAILHPRDVLMQGMSTPLLPVCDHYAGTERFVRKAFELQAQMNGVFDLTIDLEDGTSVGNEQQNLDLALKLLNDGAQIPGRRGVRVHPVDHAFTVHELHALAQVQQRSCLSYITIPKINSAHDVQSIWSELLNFAGQSCNIKLHVLIETAQALHNVWEIAAHPAVEVLDFGLMDFISAHDGAIPAAAMSSPLQFTHALVVSAKCAVVTAAAAHGKVAAHNVCTKLDDPGQARSDASMARANFGFLRMWSIHPTQIAPIISALSPSLEEIEEAFEILVQAQEHHWAPISIRGRLHDRGSYRYYWRILERAHATGETTGETRGAQLREEIKHRFFTSCEVRS